MEAKFYFTTTNDFQNGKIVKYKGVVCTNVVVGTNIFSDFAASLTDFFGGTSGSYRKKLEYIYREAMDDLKVKARKLGANAVIGTRIDFDEISGKDKSMFMVSVSGTACVVEVHNEDCKREVISGIVEQDDLDKEVLKRVIISYVKENKRIEDESWFEFMQDNPIREILNDILDIFVINKKGYSANSYLDKLLGVLRSYERSYIIPIIYERTSSKEEFPYIKDLIFSLNLFDAGTILEICKKDYKSGLQLLSSRSDSYGVEELSKMEEICRLYDSLPDTGKKELVKSGMFSKKEEEKFFCENGHVNDTAAEYCAKCGVNIKGLTSEEEDEITKFKQRVEALKNILQNSTND